MNAKKNNWNAMNVNSDKINVKSEIRYKCTFCCKWVSKPEKGLKYQAVSEEGRKPLKLSDSSHPSHRLFSLLPHGKRYRSAKSRSDRGILNSLMFYCQNQFNSHSFLIHDKL
jgi:hypothetical protein